MATKLFASLRDDVALFNSELPESRRKLSLVRGLITLPGARAAALMRLAATGGLMGAVARARLLSAFGCDVGVGAVFEGAVMLPHPTGVVIGRGARIGARVWIYQGVTIGSNTRGEYPVIEDDVRLYPQSIVTGRVRVGRGARVGAGARVFGDIPAGAIVRS